MILYQPVTGVYLCKEEPEPIKWAILGLLPSGLCLLVGASKIGKSWFALNLAISIAQGLPFLGFEAKRGIILYLALEDTKRRLYEKTRLVVGEGKEMPKDLYFMNHAYTLSEALLEELDTFVSTHTHHH